jgi:hypothetical protein
VFRVLRAGGRLAISDVVALAPLPEAIANDVAARCGCIAGAALLSDLERTLREVGFGDVQVEVDPGSTEVIAGWAPGAGYERYVASARITATKSGGESRRDAEAGGACCGPGCCT